VIGAPKMTTDKLQCPQLGSTNRLETRKFDWGLTHFRRSQLHWLDVVDRVRLRVCSCTRWLLAVDLLPNLSPAFLVVATYLRSDGHLYFPRVKLFCFVRRTFICIGLHRPFKLEFTSYSPYRQLSLPSFKRHLKTFLFSFYYASTHSAFGVF